MKRILLIDEGREIADQLNVFASESAGAFQIQTAADAEAALHRVRAWKPHVILLDLSSSSEAAVTATIKRVRAATLEDYSAILALHPDIAGKTVRVALDAGADDALALPIDADALELRLSVLTRLKELHDSVRRSNHRLDEMGNTDEITGLLNLKAVYRKGEEEIDRAGRFHKPVSAIMLNVDSFSVVNRDHGFTYGNFILQEAARRIKGCLRAIDFAGRVGGDEFFCFLRETDLSEAEFVAERVRQAFQADAFRSDKTSCGLTACLGVGGFIPGPDRSHSMNNLLHITSEALRSAKAAGADQIEIYSFG